jgi:hypothetical protein
VTVLKLVRDILKLVHDILKLVCDILKLVRDIFIFVFDSFKLVCDSFIFVFDSFKLVCDRRESEQLFHRQLKKASKAGKKSSDAHKFEPTQLFQEVICSEHVEVMGRGPG